MAGFTLTESLTKFARAKQAAFGLMAAFAGMGLSKSALAADPQPWAYTIPKPVTPIAQMMTDFHNYWLMPVITVTTIFVLILLIYTCWRFSAKRNPVPSKTTHNAALEVLWTGIPVLILVVLAFPSLKLLYATDDVSDSEMTIKVTGHQWYWNYEYVNEGFSFDAYLVARTHEEAEEYGVKRLLDTDNVLVLPVNTKIEMLFTAADVLHNWAVSDFGIRVDTVPGRLNHAPLYATKTGRYYGFCSELCGIDHAYMPIAVDIVTKEEYQEWLKAAKDEFAALPSTSPAGDEIQLLASN